ncbi:MAG: sensor domain-containing diguanylate cyclase, partial [Chloroflexota bacterium]
VPGFAGVAFLACVYYFTDLRAEVQVFYVLIVSVVGIRYGRKMAILVAVVCAAASSIVLLLKSIPSPLTWASQAIVLLIYLSAGYLAATLADTIRRQSARMAVLNEVARALSSTIDLDNLLDLIYQQLSRVISTDSYYVGLRAPNDAFIEMQIVVDDGERFAEQKIPYGAGLSSLVIQRRQPLLVRRLSVEQKTLPVKRVLIGKGRHSESWLGVPLLMRDGFTGALAVASYQANAFKEDDITLLNNIASQVALALDNARHHAQVEEQARRDSLTGAYNHGAFVAQLEKEVAQSSRERPVALIMLDIDYFKKYNDTYGHVVGDLVLGLIVQTIRTHIKRTDTVGRWGGEEFGIILPKTTVEQAQIVAQRIRQTLVTIPLLDESGKAFPKPTVSQGIAAFPDHAKSASQLVDLADAALYDAKHAGRDQVRVTGSDAPRAST